MKHSQSLSAAGFAATAVGYGPGRVGFGLFVPEFRATFSMSASAVGLVASLGFVGFLAGLFVAQALLKRRGPKAPVLSGLLAASAGMAIVAMAVNIATLAIGICLAGSSAGYVWTPFNDAVHRKVRQVDRPSALSEISTGTSIGVVAAGIAAYAVVVAGLSWRYCWAFFAAASALVLIANRAALNPIEKSGEGDVRAQWRALLRSDAMPLFAIAFVYGTTSAVYVSFAADRVREAGGVPGLSAAAAPPLVFVVYGLFGLFGLATARIKEIVGMAFLLRLLMSAGALSVTLVALVPATWGGLLGSAGLQGIHVMMTSAILASWSERLFPSLPSLSFTAALLAMALGSVLGPALAGITSDTFGADAMLLGAAVPPAATALLLRADRVRERRVL